MIAGITLPPTAVYDDGALYCSLGLTTATLARARRSGRLRFSRQGKRVLYLGEWVMDWLRSDGKRPGGASRER
jgi:hypothetical protein